MAVAVFKLLNTTTSGSNLPGPVASHCVVKKGSWELVYHIGGRLRRGKQLGFTDEMTVYNVTDQSVRILESKHKKRRSKNGMCHARGSGQHFSCWRECGK